MAFATTEQLRVELGYASFTADQTSKASRRLDAATATIQRFTRQTISQVEDDDVTLVGTWRAALVLPEVPVTEVASVVIDGETLTADTEYVFDESRTLWRGFIPFSQEQEPWRYRTPTESHWGGPETVVTVTYTHGFATIPADIVEITLNLAKRGWDNPTGATRDQIGSWARSWETNTASGAASLAREEKALLKDLRRKWEAGL